MSSQETGAENHRESMPYDVVIVGAGPAGLSAAIRLKQVAAEKGADLSVCILEKGSEVGAHILSGAVIDPRSLDELIPDWREKGCPLAEVPVTDNQHWMLSRTGKVSVPHFLTPPFMHNKGTYTGSLGNLCRWLATQAEELGVEIFPGFAAAEILYNDDGSVKGVATGDMGVARDGTHKPDYTPGLEIHAKYTFFGEGVRGHLSKQIIRTFDLAKDSQPQVYGIGIKELWDIAPENHVPGRVIHTQGWPLNETEGSNGGGFLYHQANGQVALGFVTWLSYSNPYLSPFHEMQRWKTHPEIAKILKGAKRVSYGARAISDGGLQSIPKSLIEAAAIDGAGPTRRFWTIVLPLLSPTAFFLLVVNIVYAFFETFGVIDATTQGGPAQATQILVYKVYHDGVKSADIGGSSAQSVILMIIVIALTVIQFRYIERKVQY